jgi:hypothetical protein
MHPREKLIEVLRRFDLFKMVRPFRRCIRCNGWLVPVPRAKVMDELPEKVREAYSDFRRCRGCGQVYWKGTHFERMRRFMEGILREGQGPLQ